MNAAQSVNWKVGTVKSTTACYPVLTVGDKDPDVFRPPGSGSTRQMYGSGSESRSFTFLIKALSELK